MAVDPDKPFNREEMYLAKAAGEGTTVPDEPWSRKEAYLEKISGRIDEAEEDISELDQKVAALATDFSYKGSVADYDHLPSDAAVGDVYTTEDEGYMYVWDGNSWQILNMQGKTTALYMSASLAGLAGSSTRLTLYHDAAKTQALDRSEIADITSSNSPVFLVASEGGFTDIATVTAFQNDGGDLFWTVYSSNAVQFFLDFGGEPMSTASVSHITIGPTVVQTTGASTMSVMSQDATTGLVKGKTSGNVYSDRCIHIGDIFIPTATSPYQVSIGNNGSSAISAIGSDYTTTIAPFYSSMYGPGDSTTLVGGSNNGSAWPYGGRGVFVGVNAHGGNKYDACALGYQATANGRGSIALGSWSNATNTGEMNIGSSDTTCGYNNTNYRLITGVHDPQAAHDAATKGYVDTHLGGLSFVALTQAEYDALATKDPNTLYIIKAA